MFVRIMRYVMGFLSYIKRRWSVFNDENRVVDGARLLLRTLPNLPSQEREGSFGDSDHKAFEAIQKILSMSKNKRVDNKADGMIAHLASLAEKRVILSFAPKTFYYDILKRIGELFSGPSKATRGLSTRGGGCRKSIG
ncbi:hypothetical protein Bca101_079317 [Brassica carinata]